MRWTRKLFKLGVLAGVCGSLLTLWSMRSVEQAAEGRLCRQVEQVLPVYTGIVFGCQARGGEVSPCLKERLDAALALYRAGRVQRLLLTGDHGRVHYDEVNTMMDHLMARGVPREHLFLDHAGFDTHDSMVRARRIFGVDSAVLVSQAFHLPRALYLADGAGIVAQGLAADPPQGSVCRGSRVREPLASLKAFVDRTLGLPPHHGGPPIPITGPAAASHDR